MARRPEPPPPTWNVYNIAKKPTWFGAFEAGQTRLQRLRKLPRN
jgi:hypothetical protein